MAPLPASIGRYRPVALLGAGAMGTVYKAHDPLIDRMVAVKVVRTEALDLDTKAEFLDRFRLEVQAAGRCTHPAIVGVYDYVADTGEPSIVMELVEGSSLQKALRDPAARARLSGPALLLEVLEGLGYAHGQGVIHRDIKPANIIVTPAGQAKITDFGIARLSEAALTQSGAMLGTPHYMAPEQVADDAVDRRADLFAVGAILYEIIAGRPPFAGKTIAETIQRLTGPLPADMAQVADAEPAYVSVLGRALAKERSDRFQTADAFTAALQAAMDASQATIVAAAREAVSHVSDPTPPEPRVWDAALLQRLEKLLAPHLGPLARRAVVQAAQEAGSTDELYDRLARTLANQAERSAFLRALGRVRLEPSLTSARRAGPPTSATAAAGTTFAGSPGTPARAAIPPAAISAAQAALAFFIGPIARVLVRDAAAQAASGRDFIERVCAHVPKPDELAALRRRLRAEVEPLLPLR